MKEWALRHPILTFLIADTIVAGIVNIVRAVAYAASGVTETTEVTTEEVNEDESGNDSEDDL